MNSHDSELSHIKNTEKQNRKKRYHNCNNILIDIKYNEYVIDENTLL